MTLKIHPVIKIGSTYLPTIVIIVGSRPPFRHLFSFKIGIKGIIRCLPILTPDFTSTYVVNPLFELRLDFKIEPKIIIETKATEEATTVAVEGSAPYFTIA